MSCRCHRKLCAPWCCHDRSHETLSTYHSLYFQPHWIFLFQGENIVAFYNSVTVDIFFHCHVVMLCSCPSQMLPNCYLNTLTQFTGFTHHTHHTTLGQERQMPESQDSNIMFPQLGTLELLCVCVTMMQQQAEALCSIVCSKDMLF